MIKELMSEYINERLEKVAYESQKNSFLGQHLQIIDRFAKEIQSEFPGADLDELVVKMTEMAEITAKEMTDVAFKFKNAFIEEVSTLKAKLYLEQQTVSKVM